MLQILRYGLGNHLINLINRNRNIKGITILKNKIKIFEGVNECLQKNISSSFYEQNFNYGKNKVFFDNNDLINKIFFDQKFSTMNFYTQTIFLFYHA